MKLKLAVLKKPTYIIGGIVLFFLVLWLVNRHGSSSSSGTMVAASGQDPNTLAAGVALQQAQIGASVQMASINADLAKNQSEADTAVTLAKIQAVTAAQTLDAQTHVADTTLSLQGHVADLSTSLQGHIVDSNNQLAYNTAKMAYDNANYSTAINANLQAALAADQLKAFTTQTLAMQIPTVSHKRGEQFAALNTLINQSTTSSAPANFTAPPLPQTNWVG